LESSKAIREREAAALREWFETQKRFGSWSAMERALMITKDYLRHVKTGEKRAVDPVLRAKLFETTGLEIFRPIKLKGISKKRSRIHPQTTIKKDVASSSKITEVRPTVVSLPSRAEDDAFARADSVKMMLIKLADELEFFKKSTAARKTFRRIVPGEDVGYITTLLRALYDEDQFQRWLLFSEYKLKSKEDSRD
jgi:hypothetical protein